MNLKYKVSFLVLIVMAFSCNEETKTKQNPPEVKIEKKASRLVFDVDIKTTEPDNFSLYANDVFLNNNQFMDVKIEQKLNSNETEKKLHFEFPENIKPDYQLFFSLGTKKEKAVQLKNISITYGDTKFNISSENLMEYFTVNKFIEYDPETEMLTVKKIDNRLNPLLMVRRKILDSLQNVN